MASSATISIEMIPGSESKDSVAAKTNSSTKTTKKAMISLSTKEVLAEQKLRLSLLELFDQWDTNNDEVLTTLEVIYGLRVAGFVLNAEKLRQVIDDVKDVTKNTMWGEDNLAHAHHFVDHEGFIAVMLHTSLLGNLSASKAREVVILLKDTLASDPTLTQRMQELRQKQATLVNTFYTSKRESIKWDDTVKEIADQKRATALENQEREAGNRQKRESKRLSAPILKYESDEDPHCANLKKCRDKWYTLPTCAVFLWLLVATLLYIFVNQWGVNEAFYYTVQAGLSVGFGSLSEEKVTGKNTFDVCTSSGTNATELATLILNQQVVYGTTGELCAYQYVPNELYLISMFYTVVHICLGASLIGGVLSLFTTMAVESSETWFDEANKTAESKHKTDHIKQSKKESTKLYKEKNINAGSALPPKDDSSTNNEADASKSNFTAKCTKWMNGHSAEIRATLALLFWVFIGTVVYSVLENVHWIKGLYFAVAACSTAGLAGPSGTNSASIAFVGLFTLFGVPIYAYTLGIFSNVATAKYLMKKAQTTRLAAITEQEFHAADRLGDPGAGPQDGSIDRYEFALLWFLRTGKVSPDDIDTMQNDFDDLDADDNQVFDNSEMQAALRFEKHDKNGDGVLDAGELVTLAAELQRTKCMAVPSLFLLPPKKKYTVEYIQQAMLAFEDSATTVKKKKTITSKRHGRVQSKTKQVVYLTFDRREYMRWFMSEFTAYRDLMGDGKPQGHGMRTLMLNEVISYFAEENNEGNGGDSDSAAAGSTATVPKA